MKILVLMILLAGLSIAAAQGPHHPPPPREPPVNRWMHNLREREPETFERMRRMRRQDPAGFRRALQRRLGHKRMERILSDFPTVAAAVEQLDPERRQALAEALFAPPPSAPRQPGRDSAGQPRSHEQQARSLAEALRKTNDEQERRTLRERLRGEVAAAFEQRHRRRQESIEQLRRRLEELDRQLQEWEDRREQVIDAYLDRLLDASDGDRPESHKEPQSTPEDFPRRRPR